MRFCYDKHSVKCNNYGQCPRKDVRKDPEKYQTKVNISPTKP